MFVQQAMMNIGFRTLDRSTVFHCATNSSVLITFAQFMFMSLFFSPLLFLSPLHACPFVPLVPFSVPPRTVSHPIWPFLLSSPPKNTHLAAANVSSPCRTHARTHARRQTRQTRSHLAPFSLTASRLFCCMPVSDRVIVFLGSCFAGSLAS